MAVNWALGTDPGDPINVVAFSAIVHRRSRAKLYFVKRSMSRKHTGNEDPFQRNTRTPIVKVEKFGRGGAQQVRIPMLLYLTRDMRTANDANAAYTMGVADMVDHEERIRTLNTRVWTQNMQHSAAMYNPELQDIRVAFQMSLKVTDLLSEWYSNALEERHLDALYDRFPAHVVGTSLASAEAHPNILTPTGVSDIDSLGTSHRLSANLLRGLSTWIEAVGFINPIDVDGEPCYLLLAHPYACEDLWRDPEFITSMQNGMPRSTKNPMFTMAEGRHGGIHIHKYSRIRTTSGFSNDANVRQNILLGADALMEAETSRPRIVMRKEDKYGNVAGWAIKAINGQARADYVDESSANNTNQSSALVPTYTSNAGSLQALQAQVY